MSENPELHFNMRKLGPQRNTEETLKLPLMNADDADQEKQKPEPQWAQRSTEESQKLLPLIDADDADQEKQKPGTTEATEKHRGARWNYFLLTLSMLSVFMLSAFSFSAMSRKASTISSGWSR